MKKEVHLAICCDDNYLVPASITIKSYFLHNRKYRTVCHTFSDSLNKQSVDTLTKLVEECGGELQVHALPKEAIEVINSAPLAWEYLSVTTYYRLMLPYVLGDDVQRVLYLDCDTMVRKDLSEYYFDENDFIIAGSRDLEDYVHAERLGLSKYVNAGILVMDVKQIRTKYHQSGLIAEMSSMMNTMELKCGDQDMINIMFQDKLHYFDDSFNFQHGVHKAYVLRHKKDVDDATVVHFITGDKPWKPTYCFPYTGEYYHYLKKYLSAKEKILYWVQKPIGLVMIVKKHADYTRNL